MTKVASITEPKGGDVKKPPLSPGRDRGGRAGVCGEAETLPVIIKDWANNTSAHGFPNIERAAHIVRRLFWTTVVLAGCGKSRSLQQITFYNSLRAVSTFNQNNTSEFSKRQESSRKITLKWLLQGRGPAGGQLSPRA